jgi:hypothetical protein
MKIDFSDLLFKGFLPGLWDFAKGFWWLILACLLASVYKYKMEQKKARERVEARRRRIEDDERIREMVREKNRESRRVAGRRSRSG